MRPFNIFCTLVLIAASAVSAAIAGEMTLYERPDFGGRSSTVHGEVPSFDRARFSDRPESIVVTAGYWEVCTDAYFRGRCTPLAPGEYRRLGHVLGGSISSAREIADAGPPVSAYGPQGAGQRDGPPRIDLYEKRGFGGRAITLTSNHGDLERIDFNDRANAAVVFGGVWRLCTDVHMEGTCRDLGPGRYKDLQPLGGKVNSATLVGDLPVDPRRDDALVPPPSRRDEPQ